jgi:hypothetical protein
VGKWHRAWAWAAVAATGALAFLGAVGAHLGPARAAEMFRSGPMAGVWVVLTAALLIGPMAVLSPRPGRNAGLLACYGGAALILLGAMLGSRTAHRLAARLSGRSEVPAGVMYVAEGQSTNELLDERSGEPIGTLPFEVRLERLEVVFRDSGASGASQPAGRIQDFISHLVITRDGRVLVRAAVSANRPLHVGGYHLTQTGCIFGRVALTRLTIVSDRGLGVVYAGGVLLVAGSVWQMWLLPAVAALRKRGSHGRQD